MSRTLWRPVHTELMKRVSLPVTSTSRAGSSASRNTRATNLCSAVSAVEVLNVGSSNTRLMRRFMCKFTVQLQEIVTRASHRRFEIRASHGRDPSEPQAKSRLMQPAPAAPAKRHRKALRGKWRVSGDLRAEVDDLSHWHHSTPWQVTGASAHVRLHGSGPPNRTPSEGGRLVAT